MKNTSYYSDEIYRLFIARSKELGHNVESTDMDETDIETQEIALDWFAAGYEEGKAHGKT